MKKLIRIEEGQEIPNGAIFIESQTVRDGISHYTYSEHPYGFFSVIERTTAHYKMKKVYIYEVEINETT